MRRFNHIGLPTDERRPGAIYVPQTKVWVTRPNDHPYRVEFLHFEPDSPVIGPTRDMPHVAFQVSDLVEAIAGEELLLPPFEPIEGLHVAFIMKDGAVFEFMQFDPGHKAEGFLP